MDILSAFPRPSFVEMLKGKKNEEVQRSIDGDLTWIEAGVNALLNRLGGLTQWAFDMFLS